VPKSIEARDVLKVVDLVRRGAGPLARLDNSTTMETEDGIRFLISGWQHSEGWSRGFIVTGSRETGGRHLSPIYDRGKRWEGRGWHGRMADDIVKGLEQLRARR